MSLFCGTPFVNASSVEGDPKSRFRAELSALSSWQEKSRRIDDKLRQTRGALTARNEKLLVLRGDFDALTLDFWRTFGRGLGCEDPAHTIVKEQARMRSFGHKSTIVLVAIIVIIIVVGINIVSGFPTDQSASVFVAIAGAVVISILVANSFLRIARARRVADILASEQEPFWLTSGASYIALSNLSITPPSGAKWWTRDRITFVFVRHLAPRFTLDAESGDCIWMASYFQDAENELSTNLASQILKALLPRYRQMVTSFSSLAALESDITFLDSLKAEAEQGLAEELRAAEERVTQLRAARSESGASCESPSPTQPESRASNVLARKPKSFPGQTWLFPKNCCKSFRPTATSSARPRRSKNAA
jgi:hypothetical protein